MGSTALGRVSTGVAQTGLDNRKPARGQDIVISAGRDEPARPRRERRRLRKERDLPAADPPDNSHRFAKKYQALRRARIR